MRFSWHQVVWVPGFCVNLGGNPQLTGFTTKLSKWINLGIQNYTNILQTAFKQNNLKSQTVWEKSYAKHFFLPQKQHKLKISG